MLNKIKFNSNYETLVHRAIYTIVAVICYQTMTYITLPNVNSEYLSDLSSNETLQLMAAFTGGGFKTLSILSLGISAFISAQILVQIAKVGFIPVCKRWADQGKSGRDKLNWLTRWITLFFAYLQSFGVLYAGNLLSDGRLLINDSPLAYFMMCTLIAAGTFIGLWISEQITINGLGNGVSVIIAVGILSKLPESFVRALFPHGFSHSINIPLALVFTIVLLVTLAFIVWFYDAELRLHVQFAKNETIGKEYSYLPLKVATTGVVPIIFASTFLTIPQTILSFVAAKADSVWYQVVTEFFTLSTPTGITLYGLLIFGFTYMYATMQIDPEETADGLQKQEAFILGVPSNDATENFLDKTLKELSLPCSIFLTIISVVPLLIGTYMFPNLDLGLSGSSLIIIISSLLEIIHQVNGLLLKRKYGSFITPNYEFN